MPEILKISNVTRSFRQGHKTLEILKGINLEVSKGELIGLVGASGTGKSTLLQVVGLLDRQTSGEITIDGVATSELPDDARTAIRREKLGFIYQFHHLLPDFGALENVAMAFRIAGAGQKEAEADAEKLLTYLGLGERLSHLPAKLSGGEQQRVAIARALAAKPKLILADEPTGNLDEETAGRVFDMFVDAVKKHGVAAVIATHDRTLAEKMDRQFILKDGLLQAG